MRRRTSTLAAVGIVAGLLLVGCAAAPTDPVVTSETPVGLGHVHGIADLGDGTVLLGTHYGLYTLTEDGAIGSLADGTDFDAMSLTGEGSLLYASGHPGPNTSVELGTGNLGIVRSTDGGSSWESVAFAGQEDFHVLTVGDGEIYGIGSSSNTLRMSPDGGATWVDGAALLAADLAVTVDGALYAATQSGVQVSRDAGATFAPVPDAPLLYLLQADPAGGLVGVATDGTLWRAADATSWVNVGTVSGAVQALGVTADGAIVIADDRGIVWIRGDVVTVAFAAGDTP